MFGATLRSAPTVSAGITCVTVTPTIALGTIPQAFTSQQLPICTATSPAQVRSATPTITATPAATDTPVPPTSAPSTSTPVPPAATATTAGGGVGAGIQGPNTGTGATSGGGAPWLLVAMAALALLGGGTLAYGVRRRR